MSGPLAVIERLAAAQNAHDIDAMVACFAEDYDSEQPAHPDRAFRGSAQVRANWSEIFAGVPDLRAELLRSAVDGETVWTEWRYSGTQEGGGRFDVAGVIIAGVRDDRIARARLYLEPIEQAGAGIEAAVHGWSGADE
jgi:hypothetical protein